MEDSPRTPKPGDPRAAPVDPERIPALLREGADMYNRAEYWHAHESWESAWHSLRAAKREEAAAFLQGLILTTAALENLRRAKPTGFRRQMAEALHRLRMHRGRGSELGLAEEDVFVAELLAFYIDAARRLKVSFEFLALKPPRLRFLGS